MSLGAFLQDDNYGGSWADEVEEVVGKLEEIPTSTLTVLSLTLFARLPATSSRYPWSLWPVRLLQLRWL
jgi:hypothetical protein